ncbi:MAG: hypothetical protein H7249_09715 [Chitinophagaceae bacterium]|nr:hypothetical protein [Oligoflexus sp.]
MKLFTRMLFCLLSFWFSAGPLLAGSSLDDARSAFSSGDYKKAGKLAGKAAKKSKSDSDKAEAYALAGAASVKLGKAGKGKAKFVKALKLDPNVALPSEASGDKKVEKAFAAAQKKAGSKVSDGGSGKGSDKLTKSAGRADHSPSNLKNYLPFGLNSYMQGKTMSAAAYGAAQAFGILLYLNRKQAAADADKDAKSVIADAETAGETGNEKFLKFLSDNDAFVKKANSEASLSLLLAAAGYGLSVVDSIMDPFHTSKSASVDAPSDRAYAELGTQDLDRTAENPWRFDLQILPTQNHDTGLVASLKKTF